MCLISVQFAGGEAFSKALFKNAWADNHDGGGYMFAAGGKLIVRKPFFRMKDMRNAYLIDHAQYGATSSFALHFRYATHGPKDETNTHPHVLCNGEVGLVHNGVLDFDPPGKDISDTVFFCRTVLAHRQRSFIMGPRCNAWLGELIGKWNKFVLMDGKGKVSIVNEKSGVWDGCNWHSNNGFDGTIRKLWTPTPPPVTRGLCFDADTLDEEDWKDAYALAYMDNDDTALADLEAKLDRESLHKLMEAMDKDGTFDDDGLFSFAPAGKVRW